MKDAVLCNKLRGIEKQVLIRRCPNGESRPKGQSKVVASEIDGTQRAYMGPAAMLALFYTGAVPTSSTRVRNEKKSS